jgi:hypothetical protein
MGIFFGLEDRGLSRLKNNNRAAGGIPVEKPME